MKKKLLLIAATFAFANLNAQKIQKDTLPEKQIRKDTIKIGGFEIIIKHDNKPKPKSNTDTIGKKTDSSKNENASNNIHISRAKKNKKVSTNWIAFDFGFNNYTDNTNYNDPSVTSMLRTTGTKPAPTQSDLRISTGKSVGFNFWIVQTKINVIKQFVSFKYGLGIEHNNYRYKSNISFKDASPSYIIKDSVNFSKNKFGINYATVPLMCSFNPSGKGGFSFSAGVSAGYRFNSFNKQKSSERNKDKNNGEFGLNPFKFALVGDIGYKGLRFFGSYSLTSLYDNGLKFTPYTIGLRLSKW